MKIGNGPLQLGILRMGHEELTIQELENLARTTLDIYPLGDIFHVTDINTLELPPGTEFFAKLVAIEEIRKTYSKEFRKHLDSIAIIRKKMFSKYDGSIVYSEQNPIIFAHELGHALGLEHPCHGYTCKEEYWKECLDLGYVMCWGGNDGERGSKGFSPEDIEKLEKWWLK